MELFTKATALPQVLDGAVTELLQQDVILLIRCRLQMVGQEVPPVTAVVDSAEVLGQTAVAAVKAELVVGTKEETHKMVVAAERRARLTTTIVVRLK